MLALFPILCHFIAACVVPKTICLAACRAVLAFGDVLDLVMDEVGAQPAELQAAVERALESMKAAGWQTFLKKKFHWLLHFADHLDKIGFLPKCWCPERKNKEMKHAADYVKCLKHFQRSVLEQLLAEELYTLRAPGIFDTSVSLLNPAPCPRRKLAFIASALSYAGLTRANCFVSSTARLECGARCHIGDVVLYTSLKTDALWEVGEIWFLVDVLGTAVAIISEWAITSYEPALSRAICTPRDNPINVSLKEVMLSVTYTIKKDGAAIVLIPYRHRA